jgi:hypothetical protein
VQRDAALPCQSPSFLRTKETKRRGREIKRQKMKKIQRNNEKKGKEKR